MTSMALLLALGDAKGVYLQEAQDLRAGPSPARLPRKRVLLLAAVIAALLLAGCAAVYALRMERMQAGQYTSHSYVPTEYDAQGNPIPVETREPLLLLGLQGGANQQALEEWLAFTGSYDQDLTLSQEADRTGSLWELPENHLIYGCYTEEMSQKLTEIAKKYRLQLLSPLESFEWNEGNALLESLNLEGLLSDNTGAVYQDGFAHLDGTFTLNLTLSRKFDGFSWNQGSVSCHYSQKASFDPNTDFMSPSQAYTQWEYTRTDGRQVLLVLSPTTARVYADLPKAFVSIHLTPSISVDGQQVPMTQEALQQLAEVFDLSIQPTATTPERIWEAKAKAQKEYQALQAQKQTEKAAMYQAGYQSYVQYRLDTMPNPESLSYVLLDITGDGVDELILNTLDILSLEDGQSYLYFGLHETGVFLPRFRPCGDGIFEVWCEDFGFRQYYFYAAETHGPQFLTGVTFEDGWYQVLPGGEKTAISEEAAREIREQYPAQSITWIPLTQFGREDTPSDSQDPYARYLDTLQARYGDSCEFALVDVPGDGTEALITREYRGSAQPTLHIHTLRSGSLWDLDIPEFTELCQGGILLVHPQDSEDWAFYQVTSQGAVLVEKVVRDPYTLYYGHVRSGEPGKTVSKEEAISIVSGYTPLSLDWKPISQYPGLQ